MATLHDPVKLGDIELKNRIVMASLTRNHSEFTIPGPMVAEYYAQRASAGLILTEGTMIEPTGSEWPFAPGIFNDEQVAGWKAVTDAVHAKGGKIVIQLWHIGRVAHPLHQGGLAAVGPSAVAAKGGKFRLLTGEAEYVTPVAIADPKKYVELYRAAAVRAKAAGFDGAELHAANGYLPNQFLDSASNRRTDGYGGAAANRCRFPLECLDAVASVFGSGRTGIKISPGGGYNDVGEASTEAVEALYTHFMAELEKRKLAYIQVCRYLDFFDAAGRGKPFNWEVLAKAAPMTPLMLNGNLDAAAGTEAVKGGLAAAVAFGRFWISNPDLPRRIKDGLPLAQGDYQSFYGPYGLKGEKYTFGPEWAVGYTSYPAAS